MPFAPAPGARLYYETTGSGTPIVFVHETLADLRGWEAQVHWFARSYQCIAFNARGYPPSALGDDPARHDHLRLADDIGAVMDAAGVSRAFVVGHSMGAYMAAHFALRQPQRLLGAVFAGLGGGSDNREAFRASALARAAALRREGIAAMDEEITRGPTRLQLLRKDPRGWEAYLQETRELDAQGLANILEFCHSGRPPVYELEAGLRALQVPVLIAVGDEDTQCLQPALFLKRTLPHAGVWMCPRSGHALHREEPALFNAAVQSFFHAVEHGVWRDGAGEPLR